MAKKVNLIASWGLVSFSSGRKRILMASPAGVLVCAQQPDSSYSLCIFLAGRLGTASFMTGLTESEFMHDLGLAQITPQQQQQIKNALKPGGLAYVVSYIEVQNALAIGFNIVLPDEMPSQSNTMEFIRVSGANETLIVNVILNDVNYGCAKWPELMGRLRSIVQNPGVSTFTHAQIDQIDAALNGPGTIALNPTDGLQRHIANCIEQNKVAMASYPSAP
jgi:hypothetical protein